MRKLLFILLVATTAAAEWVPIEGHEHEAEVLTRRIEHMWSVRPRLHGMALARHDERYAAMKERWYQIHEFIEGEME